MLIELIRRTKAAVRELDNANYRRVKNFLIGENLDTESTAGDVEG